MPMLDGGEVAHVLFAVGWGFAEVYLVGLVAVRLNARLKHPDTPLCTGSAERELSLLMLAAFLCALFGTSIVLSHDRAQAALSTLPAASVSVPPVAGPESHLAVYTIREFE